MIVGSLVLLAHSFLKIGCTILPLWFRLCWRGRVFKPGTMKRGWCGLDAFITGLLLIIWKEEMLSAGASC